MSNKLVTMAREILEIEGDLPFRLDYNVKHRPTLNDFEMYTFEQTWGSTALGFGGALVDRHLLMLELMYLFLRSQIRSATCTLPVDMHMPLTIMMPLLKT